MAMATGGELAAAAMAKAPVVPTKVAEGSGPLLVGSEYAQVGSLVERWTNGRTNDWTDESSKTKGTHLKAEAKGRVESV